MPSGPSEHRWSSYDFIARRANTFMGPSGTSEGGGPPSTVRWTRSLARPLMSKGSCMSLLVPRFGFRIATTIHSWCRWCPSNLLLNHVRTRRGLRWGLPLVAVGYGYLYAGGSLLSMINSGHSRSLYVAAVICCWSGVKLVLGGLYAAARIVCVRSRENLVIRRALRAGYLEREARGIDAARASRAERLAITGAYRRDVSADRHTFV